MIKVDPEARKAHMRNCGKGAGRPGLSEDKKDEIVIAYNSGQSVKEISAKLGIHSRTIYRVLKERS